MIAGSLRGRAQTDFKYHESGEALRAPAHIDRGLLTLISNPSDVEIRMADGRWVRPYCETRHAGRPLTLVLVGFTLERASAGVFCAALHRVANTGGVRRSTVLELRAPPTLWVKPAVITTVLNLRDVDESALVPFLVADHNTRFAEVHSSINAATSAAAMPVLSGANAALAQRTPPDDKLCSLPFDVLVCVLRALPFTTLSAAKRCDPHPLRRRVAEWLSG
jgi:hypothetical protein